LVPDCAALHPGYGRNSSSGNDALIPSLHAALPKARRAGLDRALHRPVGGGEPLFHEACIGACDQDRICAEKDSKFSAIFDGPNSYYWCLRRVEAGGKP
jgi:hypothetical protein